MRRWMVRWDVVGLAETWLDVESEKGVSLEGYGGVFASRRVKMGGGVGLFIRDGLTGKGRTWGLLMRGFLSQSLWK